MKTISKETRDFLLASLMKNKVDSITEYTVNGGYTKYDEFIPKCELQCMLSFIEEHYIV